MRLNEIQDYIELLMGKGISFGVHLVRSMTRLRRTLARLVDLPEDEDPRECHQANEMPIARNENRFTRAIRQCL
jgi:hypothetical protein